MVIEGDVAVDIENALIRNIQQSNWINNVARSLQWVCYGTWEERFSFACDQLMEYGGLEAFEMVLRPQSIIAFPHGTSRKLPAFIAILSGQGRHFHEAFARVSGADFTLEFVESGKYGVAGASTQAGAGAEAEDTALLD